MQMPTYPLVKNWLRDHCLFVNFLTKGLLSHETVNFVVGMVVVDSKGNVAGGTSTNGLNHKVPGSVHWTLGFF